MPGKFDYMEHTFTANGDSPEFVFRHTGHLTMYADGNLGGGTLQVKASINGGTKFNLGSPVAAAGVTHADQPAGDIIVTLAGATAPNVKVTIVGN